MINTVSEKSCQNCRYFMQHYVMRNTGFAKVCCGHCLNTENKKRTHELCEFWEDIEIRKKERKKVIRETLELMAGRLEEMVVLLKDDEEDEEIK